MYSLLSCGYFLLQPVKLFGVMLLQNKVKISAHECSSAGKKWKKGQVETAILI